MNEYELCDLSAAFPLPFQLSIVIWSFFCLLIISDDFPRGFSFSNRKQIQCDQISICIRQIGGRTPLGSLSCNIIQEKLQLVSRMQCSGLLLLFKLCVYAMHWMCTYLCRLFFFRLSGLLFRSDSITIEWISGNYKSKQTAARNKVTILITLNKVISWRFVI